MNSIEPINQSRSTFLPFSKPSVGPEEIAEITHSIESGWITTGPKVEKFADALGQYVGVPYVACVSSATAGLHLALLAHGIKAGDEVITTPMTFVATANVIVLVGAIPVFVDIHPRTLQMDVSQIEKKITPKTKAIIPVHFAGQPVDMDSVLDLAKKHRLVVIEDAAHAIGTEYKGKKIGTLGPTTVFSFHPNKNMTTGEGGAVVGFDSNLFEMVGLLRFHGLDKNAWKRFDKSGSARYDVSAPGYKYNMMDIQAAIGLHQIKKLDLFIEERTRRAEKYLEFFKELKGVINPEQVPYPHRHAWHLFTPFIDIDSLTIDRDQFMQELKLRNIGSGLHYTAVHEFSFFKEKYGYSPLDFPNAHFVSERILSLPLFPSMSDQDQEDVVEAVVDICQRFHR